MKRMGSSPLKAGTAKGHSGKGSLEELFPRDCRDKCPPAALEKPQPAFGVANHEIRTTVSIVPGES